MNAMGMGCWFAEVETDAKELCFWKYGKCERGLRVRGRGAGTETAPSNKPDAGRGRPIPSERWRMRPGTSSGGKGGEWGQTYSMSEVEKWPREGLPILIGNCRYFCVTLVCTKLYGDIQYNRFQA
jgi:hypothetical protein